MKRRLFAYSFSLGLVATAGAQTIGGHRSGAEFAASRADLQVGSSYSYLYPDYGHGGAYQINPYAALDFRHSYIGVEVDGNLTVSSKSQTHPNSVVFGLRVGGDVGHLHLFIRPGIGVGHFSGATTAPSANTQLYKVYDLGGGVDYLFSDHFNIRLSGSYQIWPNFDGNTTAALDHGGHLNPIFAGIGGAYRF